MRSARCGTRPSCKPASCTFCGIRSNTRRKRTGRRSRKTSSPSAPRRPRRKHLTGSPSSAGSGRNATRRSSGSGKTRGPNSCHSCGPTGKSHRHLHHERDRVGQRPAPQSGERPRPLPHRAGRPQVPVPGAQEPGPHRQGPQTLDQPVESRPQRLRHHLRRPPERRTEVETHKISYTEDWTDPAIAGEAEPCQRGTLIRQNEMVTTLTARLAMVARARVWAGRPGVGAGRTCRGRCSCGRGWTAHLCGRPDFVDHWGVCIRTPGVLLLSRRPGCPSRGSG